MVDSVCWSVGVGREVASGLGDELVVPERGGEGEQSQGDAGGQAGVGAPAVAFEGELALAGPEDRFDPLADGAQGAVADGFALAVGAQECATLLASRGSRTVDRVRLVEKGWPAGPSVVTSSVED